MPAAARSDVRRVAAVIDAVPTMEGAGVRLRRSIGSRALSLLDPFLLLDEIHSDREEDYEKGFPTHPHRGFETVTIMLNGVMRHRDSLGQGGDLPGGSAQWMTAGHGIVHSEMPQPKGDVFWGLQLWVNLPRAQKLMAPRYQNVAPDRIPEVSVAGAPVRVIAGQIAGQTGPVAGITVQPSLLDMRLPAGGGFDHEFPHDHTVFAYVLEGDVAAGADRTAARAGQIAIFTPGQVATLRGSTNSRVLLIAGQPLNEPVARRGPFVMNTEAELDQAVSDYQNGTLVSG